MLKIFDYRRFCFGAALPHGAAIAVFPQKMFFSFFPAQNLLGEGNVHSQVFICRVLSCMFIVKLHVADELWKEF